MRPQHITAENVAEGVCRRRRRNASMRPQHITAENALRHEPALLVLDASMRPQHITAENPAGSVRSMGVRAELQ